MKKIFLISITLLTITLSTPLFLLAQTSASISLNPRNPTPLSPLTLTLESYSFNVNTAMIVWSVDGKVVLQGQGEYVLSLRTGEVGDSTNVTVKADTADGSSLQQTITITPSSVTLLYESPQSYVPLLYKGRSLAGNGGLVRVTALPSMSDAGRIVPPSSLSYSWYVNDSILRSESGLGKQSAVIALDYLKNKTEIKAIIRSPLGNTAEKRITIYPHVIMPLLYTYDSILGPNFASVVGKRFEAVKDFTFSLEPFYASEEGGAPATAVWYLNNLPSTPLGGRILSMHPKENDYGTKMLSINVFGKDKRLQKGEARVEIIFDTRK